MADTANVPKVKEKQIISLALREEARQREAAIANPFLPAYVSPTVDTTQTETHGMRNDPPLLPIPILANEGDVKAKFRNLREHLKTMPFFIIDPKGYIPNSEIRKWLDVCLKQYETPEDGSEEPFEISAKLSKYISQRKKGFALRNAKQDLMKAIIPTTTAKSEVTDLDKATAVDECAEVFEDEADRVVKDEDAIRLRKFAREVTKKAVMEKMKEKGKYLADQIRHYKGQQSALMAQDKRIANMDPDAVGFSGPETANEDEIRVYKKLESSSPGQSTVFTDGAGLELPDFIDEQSEESLNQQDTISEARTDHSPLADIHMEAPPLMVDDEPTDTRPRTPILKGKTPMRFQKGAKIKKQGGSPAVFPSSDSHTEVGRASAINDIKVEEATESEPHEMFKLEVQPEVTVDDLMAPEEGERVVSGASGLDKTVKTDASRRGHVTAADSGREPTKRHRRKEDDRSEQGAAKERDLEGSGW
nr:unnamed protein product [Spirometra erinaceieuropaei]